ncbi:hypothetical protein AB1Y20_017498 [Prymnesium parvum]|uniref:NADP-dependent oxidoreductase domain-containing protein n=1 Tax=Prymnesium parvum TaxID=97485 RepID=A0AB34JPB7_PRYPA
MVLPLSWLAAAVVEIGRIRRVVPLRTSAGMLDGSSPVPDVFSVPSSYSRPSLRLPAIGAGTLAWGDPTKGWGINYNTTDVREAFEVLTDGGVNLFDTSEVYGYQGFKIAEGSEQLVGSLAARMINPPLLSTTFMPVPWANVLSGGGVRIGRGAVTNALRNSIARLGVGTVDLYSLHAPLPYLGGSTALYEGLAEAYSLGLCRGVGVCNFDAAQVREAHRSLHKLGVPLVSNKIRYSLLNIERELDGTIETCLELGITPIAHTPLAKGLATSRYVEAVARRSRSRVGKWEGEKLRAFSRVFEAMSQIAEKKDARTETQVALRFVMAKGCVPIPGVNNAEQAREVVAATDWELTLDEIDQLTDQAIALHVRRRDHPWLRTL